MLHTFPFGGSKTALDGLVAGLPVVVLATQQLRCRMAYSYYITMNLEHECCITYNADDYVNLAVRLGMIIKHICILLNIKSCYFGSNCKNIYVSRY